MAMSQPEILPSEIGKLWKATNAKQNQIAKVEMLTKTQKHYAEFVCNKSFKRYLSP